MGDHQPTVAAAVAALDELLEVVNDHVETIDGLVTAATEVDDRTLIDWRARLAAAADDARRALDAVNAPVPSVPCDTCGDLVRADQAHDVADSSARYCEPCCPDCSTEAPA